MANAAMTAPSKKDEFIEIDGEQVRKGSNEEKFLSMEFDATQKYVFELSNKNPQRELPIINARTNRSVEHQDYQPLRNIVYTSQIVWNGRRRMVRYYDGCDSIFFDRQPKEKEIVESVIRQTQRREFIYGKFSCEGYERMLLLYLLICSWNTESPFRTNRATQIFRMVDNDARAQTELDRLDESEKAILRAKDATFQKMRIHGSYLGIDLLDYDSGNPLTEKELRLKYRRKALDNPDIFNESYGNEKLDIKFFIETAMTKGIISNKFNQNKATWGERNSEICDISGLVSQDAIAQKIFEFSQTEAGGEFLIQLKAIAKDF